jgi:virginiamycin B lyase
MSTQVHLTVEQLERRDVPSGLSLQTYKIPRGTNFPDQLTLGGDGNIWFTSGLAATLSSITPSGRITVYNTSAVTSHKLDGLTRGPNGNIWFVEGLDNKIGEITPTGSIKAFTLGHDYLPGSVTTGPDHNLWVSTVRNTIGRVTQHGHVTWFQHRGELIHQIVSFHGALYFAEEDAIGRVTTHGTFSRNLRPHHGGTIGYLAVGPDNKLWFSENTRTGTDFVGSLTASGHIQEYPVAVGNSGLGQITAGGDGNLYVRLGDNLVGMHPDGTAFVNQYLGFIAGEGSVTKGSDGNVWYAEGVLGQIGVARGTA